MLESFTPLFLDEMDRLLASQAANGELSVNLALQQLQSRGFLSSFYFDAVPNAASSDHQLILSAAARNSPADEPIGIRVAYRSTAIGRAAAETLPIVQGPQDGPRPDDLQRLLQKLELTDKYRASAPIYVDSQLVGALCCSWAGEKDILTPEHSHGLRLVCSLLSRYWSLANQSFTRSLTSDIQRHFASDTATRDVAYIVDRITSLARDAVDGTIAACFEYNSYSGRLEKLQEHAHEQVDPHLEAYYEGEFITGTAWTNTAFRHIVDFDDFRRLRGSHVEPTSLIRHNKILGQINTILYSKLASKQKPILLRIMNRRDDPRLPFTTWHRIRLDAMCDAVCDVVDDAITANRLRHLQQLARTAISNINDPQKTISECLNALGDESVTELLVLAHGKELKHINHTYFTHDTLQKYNLPYTEWETDPFFRSALAATAVKVLNLDDYSAIVDDRHLVSHLRRRAIKFLVIVPFESPRIRGFVAVPAPPAAKGAAKALLNRLPRAHRYSLQAYAAALGSCVETAESYLTSENARRLIGHIGHEVKGPVAELGQAGLALTYTIEAAFEELVAPGADVLKVLNEITRERERIAMLMQQVNNLMSVAIDMAQETHGVLQLEFKSYNLYDVMRAAGDEVLQNKFIDYKGVEVPVRFDFNEGSRRLSDLVGDPTLLSKVFVNLFHNAFKYSIPPGRNRPIVIEVVAQPQATQQIVEIRNWGVPVPDEIREKIFQPFVRGDFRDRLTARRGMGLGLYIARRFLAAHKGVVFCKASDPTLDDPARRMMEGWSTVFEVRLQAGLTVGTFEDAYK